MTGVAKTQAKSLDPFDLRVLSQRHGVWEVRVVVKAHGVQQVFDEVLAQATTAAGVGGPRCPGGRLADKTGFGVFTSPDRVVFWCH